MISVIIPVKDGGDDLRRCLDGIARQRVEQPVELLVVDRDSRDGSRELARLEGARVLEVGASEFRHGATRNLAARTREGELLVFTSQDAYAGRRALAGAARRIATADESLAGMYGRQIPHDDATPPERFFLDSSTAPTPRLQRASTRASCRCGRRSSRT